MPDSAVATTSDGVQLSLRRFAPACKPTPSANDAGGAGAQDRSGGAVILAHAMMANARYLEPLARALAARGVCAITLDFRGHGASVPPFPATSSWRFDDYVERDLPAAVAQAARLAGCAPGDLSFLGHSLGGLVGLAAFATGAAPTPRRLVLVATTVWRPHGLAVARRARLLAMEWLARRLHRFPARALGFGTDDEPESYIAQLCGWARSGRWQSQAGADYGAALARIAAPTLVVVADRDPYCSVADGRDLVARLGPAARLRRVGRAHGDIVDSDHFGFFTRPALVTTLASELAAWMVR